MIITFDGTAQPAKNEVLKLLIKRTSFRLAKVTPFFRAIAYFYNEELGQKKKSELNLKLIDMVIDEYLYKLVPGEEDELSYFSDGKISLINEELYHETISQIVPVISKHVRLRECIHERIREVCKEGDWIIDGRDAGAIIFPNAELKFYLDIDSYVTERNFEPDDSNEEKKSKSKALNNTIFHKEKLYFSSSMHSDTIYINVSHLKAEEVYEKIIKIIKFKIKYN